MKNGVPNYFACTFYSYIVFRRIPPISLADLQYGVHIYTDTIHSLAENSTMTATVRKQKLRGILRRETEDNNGYRGTGCGVGSWNRLMVQLAHDGKIEDARKLFEKIPQRTVVSWNVMIDAYVQNGRLEDACKLFDKMYERNIVSWTIMIAGYAQSGRIEDARHLFDKMPERDVVTWNAMITGYVQNGKLEDARQLFNKMSMPNVASWNTMITGYAQNGMLEDACELFSRMPKKNVISWTTMVTGYAQNSRIQDARKLFSEMPNRNIVSWNAMISGFAQNGHSEEALKLFSQMLGTGMKPIESTFTSVISACAALASPLHGQQVHTHVMKRGTPLNSFMGNALITMYAKCGRIYDARCMFEILSDRNVITWNAIISGYAQHGHAKEALQLFDQMRARNLKADDITFIGVLSACSHAGLVVEGWNYFDAMSRDHGILPKAEHHVCMVDLLGRSGMLNEAEDLINKMPFEPVAVIWKALLGACRVHMDADIGRRAAEHLFELEPQNSAAYVLLSNIYAVAGRWDDVAKVRIMMKERRVKKDPGCSWIEVKNAVHTFVVEDRSHPQIEEIHAMLEQLAGQMEQAGYVPNVSFALHNVKEDHKQHLLCHHSEKLAIAFGLISTPPGVPIQIMKNLRMCGDCHVVTKFISKIVEREIIVRDANRFHRFKDGLCSCGDYW